PMRMGENFDFSQTYSDHFRIGGMKLFLDGSPQGKTAWLSHPYHIPPEGKGADYRGYPTSTDEALAEHFAAAYERGVPVLAHTNGDAAAEQLINAVTAANDKYGQEDRRTVMIHAQTVRDDQLDRMKLEGMVPSFFVAHTFFWGDWHRDSVLGPERAARISPLKSALDRDIVFTTHTDTPVVPANFLHLMWTAVNRETRSGETLGADQRVSALDALKSVTINAAWQYFEEESKGSITPGKRADMVILSDNPLKVDPSAIKAIQVVETIKDGETVYRRAE
ncbi:MAG: amidohydrolase, partial [bacterium]